MVQVTSTKEQDLAIKLAIHKLSYRFLSSNTMQFLDKVTTYQCVLFKALPPVHIKTHGSELHGRAKKDM